MRRLALLLIPVAALCYASAALAYVSPGKPTGFVNDYAEIIPLGEKAILEQKLANLEKATQAEVAVVTLKSLDGDTIENFAVKLFEEWKIGKAKEDNGLLILVAPNEREVRIEVGYGLEPIVTDAASFGIIQSIIVPEFKSGNYVQGIDKAVDAVSSLIKLEISPSEFEESQQSSPAMADFVPFVVIILMQLVPVIIYSKSWWLGGVIGLVLGIIFLHSLLFGGIFAVVGLIIDYFLSKAFGGRRPAGSPGVWFGGMGGGRGFGGGGGGGFGGFGGGSSGGGGASGRW